MLGLRKDVTEENQKEEAEREKQKVILREFNSTDQHLSTEGFQVYYCGCCGNYCIILDQPLESFPVRKFDQTRVLELKEHKYSYKLDEGEAVFILRKNRKEVHYLLICQNCRLPIAYKTSKDDEIKYIYIFNDSICDDPNILRSQIPDESHLIPFSIERPTESSLNTDVYVHVTYNSKQNQIVGIDDQFVYIHLKISDSDEAKRNSYLLRYLSDLFIISHIYISLSMNSRGLYVEFENHDPEDIYLKIRKLLNPE